MTNYLLETNLTLLATGLIYIWLLSGDSNFQLRRGFILSAIVMSLLAPVISFGTWVDQSTVEFNPFKIISLEEITIGGQTKSIAVSTEISWFSMVTYLYMAMVVLLFVRLVLRLMAIQRIVRQGCPVEYGRVKLIDGKGLLPTFSFFNILVLSDLKMEGNERDQIISHELVHINQLHSIDVLLLEILSIVFWYNPIVWFLKKAQAENHEYIADREVEKEYGREQYQNLLVKMTIDRMNYVGNYFSKIETIKRINMMNEKQKKSNQWRWAAAGFSVMMVLTILACNDGLVDSSSENEYPDMPRSMAQKMAQLQKENPNMSLGYYEVEPVNKGYNTEFHSGIDSRDILFTNNFEDRNRLGIIYNKTSSYQVYEGVDETPEPKDGIDAFYGYIMRNMKYPTDARNNGIEGRVFVQFVVDKNGDIVDVKAVKGIGFGCDEEAVRVVKNAEAWKAGVKDGIKVDTKMVLPISFRLPEMEKNENAFNDIQSEKEKDLEEIVVVGKKSI